MQVDWELYKYQPGFVLAFHGCDKKVGEAVLRGKAHLTASENDYDWLGTGIYFWEGNPRRALEFAQDAVASKPKSTKGKIRNPFVVGAVVDLGYCMNLMDSSSLAELRLGYDALATAHSNSKTQLPENKVGPEKVKRYLDRAVIEATHELREIEGLRSYDTVRSGFWEGGELYPGAGISAKAHIQIAVRNPSCIRGYFRPIAG